MCSSDLKDVGAAIVSVDEPRPATAWRWGGPSWRVQAGRAGMQRVRGMTLHAPDPRALASRWAEVLGRPAPIDTGDCWRLVLTDGFADFRESPGKGGTAAVTGFTLAVADPVAVRARAQAAGLAVDGLGFSLMGVALTLEPL